jgi:2,4-dienoyl-CoA reductase-like NADH-dependent reductase (Old Yellow Enzyme family)
LFPYRRKSPKLTCSESWAQTPWRSRTVHHDHSLRTAITLATDKTGDSDRRIAGIWQLTKAFAQTIHTGRTSHVDLQPNGECPVAPSAIPYHGHAFLNGGFVPVSPARKITVAEVREVVEDFRKAAERAFAAGMDGVEIHSANEYLLDHFLQDGSNHRPDEYGGSIENRARFLMEVTKAVVSVLGPGRVGVRIGPSGTFNEMSG